MHRLKRFTRSPAPYFLWAVLVCVSLVGTYFAHPHIFGFATLGLAWLTAAVALVGMVVILTPKAESLGGRLAILGSLMLAAAAIAAAFATLGTFNWA